MSDTTHLRLPLLAAAQAQKHVTHNESLLALDALVHLAVLSRSVTVPPASPAEGERYIVAPAASGEWSGWDMDVAAFQAGSWRRYLPQPGWVAWIGDEASHFGFDGADWVALKASLNQQVATLGVNASADAANKLAVSSPAILFNHAGDGTQLKLNKNLATDTASLLLQTGFSGRAEMGLAGDDDFHIKVSADGSAWNDAMTIDAGAGTISISQPGIGLARSGNGAVTAVQMREEEISLSGASADSSIVIGAGEIVLGVTSRTTETVTGASSYDCGIAGNIGKFGTVLSVGAGATHAGTISPERFAASAAVRISANGGSFTGGKVRLAIHVLTCSPPLA